MQKSEWGTDPRMSESSYSLVGLYCRRPMYELATEVVVISLYRTYSLATESSSNRVAIYEDTQVKKEKLRSAGRKPHIL